LEQIKIHAIKFNHDMGQWIQLDLIQLAYLWIIPKVQNIYLFSTLVTTATERTSMDRAQKTLKASYL